LHHRDQVLWLNTELFLTHDFSLIARNIGLECFLLPTRYFTRSIEGNSHDLIAIAQAKCVHEGTSLMWIMALEDNNPSAIHLLLDQLCIESGQHGSHFITASIEETSLFADILLANGFHTLGWEQAWIYPKQDSHAPITDSGWKMVSPVDIPVIQRLQNEILSPADQLIAPSIYHQPPQFIHFTEDGSDGFAFGFKYNDSVIIYPFFSSKTCNPEVLLQGLIDCHFPFILPVYIVARSESIMSESILLEHYKIASGKRLRMVKHLAVRNAIAEFQRSPLSNGRNTDVLSPLSKSVEFKDKI
jgi:hypothetical protein